MAMKRFNIAKNAHIIIEGVRIPEGAIYGLISGRKYYMTDTHFKRNGETMSYFFLPGNGRIEIKKDVNDEITLFVHKTLEKHKIQGTGVLYKEIGNAKIKEKKEVELAKQTAEKERRNAIASAKKDRYLKICEIREKESHDNEILSLMKNGMRRHKHKFTVHDGGAYRNEGRRLDQWESTLAKACQYRLNNLYENQKIVDRIAPYSIL